MVAKKEPKLVKLTILNKDLAVAKSKLKQAANSVDEVEMIHVLQYLTPAERIALFNELYRVMKPGAKCQSITPHWASNRAYADLRVEFPPVVEAWFFNLNEDARKQDPGGDKRYKCNFNATWGYAIHPLLHARNQEYQQHAMTFWKEAAQDLIATLTKG